MVRMAITVVINSDLADINIIHHFWYICQYTKDVKSMNYKMQHDFGLVIKFDDPKEQISFETVEKAFRQFCPAGLWKLYRRFISVHGYTDCSASFMQFISQDMIPGMDARTDIETNVFAIMVNESLAQKKYYDRLVCRNGHVYFPARLPLERHKNLKEGEAKQIIRKYMMDQAPDLCMEYGVITYRKD